MAEKDSETVKGIAILVMLTMAAVGCATDEIAAVEQDNCTSPPVAPGPESSGRPMRGKAECIPAYVPSQATADEAERAAAAVGVPLDPARIDVRCGGLQCTTTIWYGSSYLASSCTIQAWNCQSTWCNPRGIDYLCYPV